MSSMGREADEIAAQVRERNRRRAARANNRETVIRFAISTLEDRSISDAAARRTAFLALSLIARLQ